MTPARWAQIRNVLEGAIEQPVEMRQAYLEAACGFDVALRGEVEKLMASHKTGEYLEQPALHMVVGMSSASTVSRITADSNEYPTGYTVGPYQLQKRIGRGGMGSVWLANRIDHEFDRTVAVKLVHRGRDTEEILRRFKLERQVLAGLEHPNIARLIDGGSTTEGLPFLAMEYVEGIRIDDYCQQHALTVRQKIALFRQVCAAVGYAHRNLVVHRDIKASNILVTADGTPKLLDFGIAKLLRVDSSVSETRPDMRPMTLDYASPEQVTGKPITTASDVYSMGVLLYKLLVGAFPYGEKTNIAELHQAIQHSRAILPSDANKSLNTEVDAILMKALSKEPAQRYASAEHFSEDLTRYLDGRPVLAMGDAIRYRTEKFVRRNWKVALAASIIVGSLVGGVLLAATYIRSANRDSALLRQRFQTAEQEAVKQQAELSTAYFRIADLQAARGDTENALSTARAALAAAERFAQSYQGNTAGTLAVALASSRAGAASEAAGQTTQALEYYRKAASEYDRLVAGNIPLQQDEQRDQIAVARKVGISQFLAHDYIATLATFSQALTFAERLNDKVAVASLSFWIAETLSHNNAADASLGRFRKAFESWREVIGSKAFAPVPAVPEYEAALVKLAAEAQGPPKSTLEADLTAAGLAAPPNR